MSDTNSFSATRVRKIMWRFCLNDCVREIWRENKLKSQLHNEHWLTSTAFSPFGAPWTNVTKGICIQVQRCSKPTHDHAAS